MKKTKIDWADSTWNPVTGCLHGCEYCYARGIASRFAGCDKLSTYMPNCQATWRRVNPDSDPEDAIFEVDAQCPPINIFFDAKKQKVVRRIAPYPWGFQPTLRRDKLSEPSNWKKPRNIFVCSMADLFGDWVPDAWIQEVFEACEAAPQHRYIFLTKNPKRYAELRAKGIQPPANGFIGTSATISAEAIARTRDLSECWNVLAQWFVSVEPIHERMSGEALEDLSAMHWVIIGAETGNRKGKVISERAWVQEIADTCAKVGTPVFMKESLRELMGSDFRQEFPWEV